MSWRETHSFFVGIAQAQVFRLGTWEGALERAAEYARQEASG